jgi:hypothetical protein
MAENICRAPKPSIPPLAHRPKNMALALGISEKLLFDWTREGKIPHCRPSPGTILYPVRAVEKWLDELAAAQQAAQSEPAEGGEPR